VYTAVQGYQSYGMQISDGSGSGHSFVFSGIGLCKKTFKTFKKKPKKIIK